MIGTLKPASPAGDLKQPLRFASDGPQDSLVLKQLGAFCPSRLQGALKRISYVLDTARRTRLLLDNRPKPLKLSYNHCFWLCTSL